MYEQLGDTIEAENMGFGDLKVKSKLQMKYFKGKITGVLYILVWRSYQQIGNFRLYCRRYKVLVELINQQEA